MTIFYMLVYMTEEEKDESPNESATLYYIIGAILLVVLIVAGYFVLKPKGESILPALTPVVPTPTPRPITALACESQYYNPVIGFPEYYLSVEGVDLPAAKTVNCTFTISEVGAVVATASAKSPMTLIPQRNGNTFRCTTSKLTLTPETSTTVDVLIKDDLGATTSCTKSFLLPKP